MTSPAVNMVAKYSRQNIFSGEDAPKIIDVAKKLTNPILNMVELNTFGVNPEIAMGKLIDERLGIPNDTILPKEAVVNEDILNNIVNFMRKYYYGQPDWSSAQMYADYMADMEEFIKAYTAAQETTALAQTLLSLNQGIPNTTESSLSKLRQVKQIVLDAEDRLGIHTSLSMNDKGAITNKWMKKVLENNPNRTQQEVVDVLVRNQDLITNFNPEKWLKNEDNYRERIAEYYDLIKNTWNVFDVVNRSKSFNKYIELWKSAYFIDQLSSKKSQVLRLLFNEISKNKYGFVNEETLNKFKTMIDQKLIANWLSEANVAYTLNPGSQYVADNGNIYSISSRFSKALNNDSGIASFKYYMEHEFIPSLKADPTFKNNAFVQGLVISTNRDVSFYKLNMDMLAKNASSSNIEQYQSYLDGLVELTQMPYSDLTYTKNEEQVIGNLSDMFLIYNLIVNRNQYGSERMTNIFHDLINSTSNNDLLLSYYQDMGESDFDKSSAFDDTTLMEKFHINLNDFYRAIAPTVTEKQAERMINPIVRMIKRTANGTYIRYMENTGGKGKYNKSALGGQTSTISSLSEAIKQLQSYEENFPFKSPYWDSKHFIVDNLISENDTEVVDALQKLITDGYLDITRHCGE